MASLPRRRSAWNWSTRCNWFTSILGMASVKVVAHWKYRVLVVKVRCEIRIHQWQLGIYIEQTPRFFKLGLLTIPRMNKLRDRLTARLRAYAIRFNEDRVAFTATLMPNNSNPRVGFIVTNMARAAENVVAFYNKRGTCEQWIKGARARSNGRGCHLGRSRPTLFDFNFTRLPTISATSCARWQRRSRSRIGR
jgi:hypothetical protein